METKYIPLDMIIVKKLVGLNEDVVGPNICSYGDIIQFFTKLGYTLVKYEVVISSLYVYFEYRVEDTDKLDLDSAIKHYNNKILPKVAKELEERKIEIKYK